MHKAITIDPMQGLATSAFVALTFLHPVASHSEQASSRQESREIYARYCPLGGFGGPSLSRAYTPTTRRLYEVSKDASYLSGDLKSKNLAEGPDSWVNLLGADLVLSDATMKFPSHIASSQSFGLGTFSGRGEPTVVDENDW